MKMKFFIVSILLVAIFATQEANAQNGNDRKLSSMNIYSDGEFLKGETDVRFTEDGRKYRIRLKGTTLDELEIDGQKIPKEDFPKYESLVKRVITQMEEHRKEAKKHREEAAIHREEAEKFRQEADGHRKEAEQHRKEAEQHRKQTEDHRKEAEDHRADAEIHRKEAEKHREIASQHREAAEDHRKQAEEHRKLMEEFVSEIVKANIVGDRDDLKEVILDQDVFSVNGKKQSAEVHQRFKKQFLKENRPIRMSFSNGNTTLSID